MYSGVIFNIARFCISDGPGIRTTVFFKGCPLRCRWCHNPESWSERPELAYAAESCVNCGRCAAACPMGCHTGGSAHRLVRTACTVCGACADVCSAGALAVMGRHASVAEILAEAVRDKPFYEVSGGGLTLSGGEPLHQPEFALSLLREARKAGLHTCVETCGYVAADILREAAGLTDLFLYDYKATDPTAHRELTGVDNIRILRNLEELDRLDAAVVLRAPLIPGCNDSDAHAHGIAAVASRCRCVRHVEVLPYHELGASKAARIGRGEGITTRPPDKKAAAAFVKQVQLKANKSVVLA